MAKSVAERLTNSKSYREEFGNRPLSPNELWLLDQFDEQIGFTYDRRSTLVKFIKQGYSDWIEKWNKAISLKSASLDLQIILYGVIDGTKRYKKMNLKKTAKFDHSHETQLSRAIRSGKKSKGSKTHSVRSIQHWIKKGFTIEEATKKVQKIQSTNTLEKYIKKYGIDLGTQKFLERNQEWSDKINTPEVNRRKSLGLWRYIERYGEIDGKIKYLSMRNNRNIKNSIGRASKESIEALAPIINYLDQNGIFYYMGLPNNKEWFIYDKKLNKPFFYDLTIPSLSIIIEYHGEAFHANPNWSTEKQLAWCSPFSKISAAESIAFDTYKKQLAKSNGWTVFEMYSSEVTQTVKLIFEQLN